jgi:hypothetical protein
MPVLLQWTRECSVCGWSNGVYPQSDQPDVTIEPCNRCEADPSLVEWKRYGVNIPEAMFMAEPEIPSHYNTSLGCKVESRSHLKALQAQHGCMDAVVKGDASKTMVPRDIDTKAKYYDSLRNQDAAGFSAVDAHGGAE